MNTMTLIGFGFLAVLVIFLMIAFFVNKTAPNINTYQIIRFFISLGGGFALAFIGGGVTFDTSGNLDSGQEWAITSFGGAALFLIIWLTYGKYKPAVNQKETVNGIKFSIPKGVSFSQGIKTLVKGFKGTVKFENFSDEEKKIKLNFAELQAPNKINALLKVKELSDAIPDYDVTDEGNSFTITKK